MKCRVRTGHQGQMHIGWDMKGAGFSRVGGNPSYSICCTNMNLFPDSCAVPQCFADSS